jgi:hypothetical protein
MLGFDDYGEEMGRNDVSVFLCNASVWGGMGRNRVSPLEMGTEGKGRVSGHPHRSKRLESAGEAEQDRQLGKRTGQSGRPTSDEVER